MTPGGAGTKTAFEGSAATNVFQVTVCSPGWIAAFKKGEVLVGKRYILTDRFDWPKIKQAIHNYVEQYCVGSDEEEVYSKLKHLGFQMDEAPVLTEKESRVVADARDKLRRLGRDAFLKEP